MSHFSDQAARELLAEALDFFNDHPRFSLRRDRRRDSYELASRIEKYLSPRAATTDPAIAQARHRWSSSDFLRIDDDENIIARDEQGEWVRAWLRIEPALPAVIDPVTAQRYRHTVAALPEPDRSVLLAHQQDGQSITQIAERLAITTSQVERHLADALMAIARAIGTD